MIGRARRFGYLGATVLVLGASPGSLGQLARTALVPRSELRPGAALQVPRGLCTAGFLFAGADGARYLATAGHCVLSGRDLGAQRMAERTWAPGAGPPALDWAGRPVGRFAYALVQAPLDFALVRLDPAVAAGPRLLHFGGPTGIFRDTTSRPLRLQFHGNGFVLGGLLPDRIAVALGATDDLLVKAVGAATPGDSGSGVETADGRAVGLVVSLGTGGNEAGARRPPGPVGISRLPVQIARAEGALRTTLTLQTAPR